MRIVLTLTVVWAKLLMEMDPMACPATRTTAINYYYCILYYYFYYCTITMILQDYYYFITVNHLIKFLCVNL